MIKSDVIILAGGLGTRLKHIINDIPKPMAPVNNQPFLYYILQQLNEQGTKHVILSVGYMHYIIKDYFNNSFKNIQISYSTEEEPLGTGGAIKKAIEYANTPKCFIVNGDTFFDINLTEMETLHEIQHIDLSIAVKEMNNFERYGSVQLNDQKITGFEEKQFKNKGFINGGIYLINKEIIKQFDFPEKFSFENDFFEKHYNDIQCTAYKSDSYFIDIGVPDDYKKAQVDFSKIDAFK